MDCISRVLPRTQETIQGGDGAQSYGNMDLEDLLHMDDVSTMELVPAMSADQSPQHRV